ncbi:MAG: tRNA (adenosine(37)-N6)-dimethylallyltransferase MiaA [Patescibacteria group bacterium]|nr:tRNA (adenosine(37)-N6)-dimethylallyltransferase MiaA [Patescibacteria group bacterium]
MSPLIVIAGPTASGKTALAIEIATRLGGEIVNADSRQIYRELFVGTATPIRPNHIAPTMNSGIEIEGVMHHLFGIVSPDYNFTLAAYKQCAVTAVRDIQKRGGLAFLVGGTGLYIRAVVDNLLIPEVPPQQTLRSALELRSTDELYAILQKDDPDALSLTGRNRRRMIRAIEVVKTTGKKFTELRSAGEPLFTTLQIGLSVPLEELDRRIEARARAMLDDGLLEEVKNLLKTYPPDLPAFDTPGYREFINYLKGTLTYEEAVEQFVRAHKQLARRQLRWFRRDRRIVWVKPDEHKMRTLIERFLGAS